jgi:hypothetical protein
MERSYFAIPIADQVGMIIGRIVMVKVLLMIMKMNRDLFTFLGGRERVHFLLISCLL